MGTSRVVVGRLGRPHGIRGEVTVEIRTDEPELRFAPGSSVFLPSELSLMPASSFKDHFINLF